ncbi:hypothetical protein ACR77J_07080 [Tissierella praeacuta]|uniref:hypothetical protein n=1 Tax=Tissierella praeacuta TaxID=43131 RepID=UPI003DA472BA
MEDNVKILYVIQDGRLDLISCKTEEDLKRRIAKGWTELDIISFDNCIIDIFNNTKSYEDKRCFSNKNKEEIENTCGYYIRLKDVKLENRIEEKSFISVKEKILNDCIIGEAYKMKRDLLKNINDDLKTRIQFTSPVQKDKLLKLLDLRDKLSAMSYQEFLEMDFDDELKDYSY